jgi:spermidine synthase
MSMTFALAVAALSGFVALSYEILWYRLFAFAAGGTAPGFALLLGFYLYGLAAGGLVARRICRGKAPRASRQRLLALAAFTVAANTAGYLVVPALTSACTIGGCLIALPAVALSTALLGATLPLLSHAAIPPDWQAGSRLSILYFANILGSAAGSLITGYGLMEWWPSSRIAVFIALLGLGLAAVFLRAGRAPAAAYVGLGLAAAGCVSATPQLFDQLYEKLLFKQRFRPELRFANTLENRAGVINIMPSGRVFGGGVYDGYARIDLMSDPNLLVRVVAIPAFHPQPKRVLAIGLSMGAWEQILANLPGVEHLTVVEINRGYLSLIPRYPDVASLLHNPRVTIVIDDGRRWLTHHPDERFDLIVANISFHWREHATNLLSREFLELVRSHLAPGGVYYYNTTSSVDAFKTAFTVFPYGLRIMNFAAVSDSPLRFDTEAWRRGLEVLRIDGRPVLDLTDPAHRRRLEQILALADPATAPPAGMPAPTIGSREDALRIAAGARVITDDNMATEWRVWTVGAWDP